MMQAGLAEENLTFRRAAFAALFVITMVASLWLMVLALAPGGYGILDLAALACFAATLPWMVAGFWNAVIGFAIMRFAADPAMAVMPSSTRVRNDDPVTASTAILMCVRNELPSRIVRNLELMLAGLVESGYGERFHLYILSDTNDADLVLEENDRLSDLARRWHGRIEIIYRRRTVNTGYKAGNIRDFCQRWGSAHELAVTLDADSFMTADAILRLVRIMQVDSRLGILQGLVVGLPSTSLFARIFQFGMRLGMRSYTIGSAWWQSDCGPYWGHNAVLRLEPFIRYCELPVLMDGGEERHILSHDQIEAAMMRSAGYHVRVVAREDLGWEENPPTLLEFMRRDVRWCQGNMQYFRFLSLDNLKPVSRYQLLLAIVMFIGSPAWIGLLVLATIALVSDSPAHFIRADLGNVLFAWVLVMWFSPKIFALIDLLLRVDSRNAFGGGVLIIANFFIDIIYSVFLCPILWISHTIFLVGLLFNREVGWIGQVRDDHVVSFRSALSALWPQTLLGWTAIGLVSAIQPAGLPYVLFLAVGPAFAIFFAMLTAWPALGRLAMRVGIGRLPEETAAPKELLLLSLPAVRATLQPSATASV
jgi:membrane glycosyltransferase